MLSRALLCPVILWVVCYGYWAPLDVPTCLVHVCFWRVFVHLKGSVVTMMNKSTAILMAML